MTQSLLLIVAFVFGQPIITADYVDSDTCMDRAHAVVRTLNKIEGVSDAEGICISTEQRRA